MSRHQVVRNGLGPLHIAEPTRAGWEALCGGSFTAPTTWRPGRQSVAVWQEWKHCTRCEVRDRELRTR
jgi:hypothetical protein